MITSGGAKSGGISGKVALELYDKAVVPVVIYGSAIWGYSQYNTVEDV